ncbi:MAG: hypothetical protein WAQ76_00195, partial [Gemmiger qucibialis]
YPQGCGPFCCPAAGRGRAADKYFDAELQLFSQIPFKCKGIGKNKNVASFVETCGAAGMPAKKIPLCGRFWCAPEVTF